MRSELENTELREKLDTLEKTVKEEDNQEPKKRVSKLKEDPRYDKRGKQDNVNHIGLWSSGEELE